MRDRIWLPVTAAAIFLAASTALYNLLGASSATPLIQGGTIGLVLAAIAAMESGRVGWISRLLLLVPLVALIRWVALPLIAREPMFAGFDGTNPAVLVPGSLYLVSFGVVFCSYAPIAHRRVAAN